MAKHNEPPNQGHQWVKIRAKPLKGPSCQAADFAVETDISILSGDDNPPRKNSTYQPPNIMSTGELISTVGQIWDCASSSLSRFQPKANHPSTTGQKDSKSCYPFGDDNFGTPDLMVRCLHVDLKSSHYHPSIVQQSLEVSKPAYKITYTPCDDYFIENFFRNRHCIPKGHQMHSKEVSCESVGSVSRLAGSYGWMSQIGQWPDALDLPVSSFWGSIKILKSFSSEAAASARCRVSGGDEAALSSTSGTPSVGLCTATPVDLSSDAIAEVKAPVLSCSDHCPHTAEDSVTTRARMSIAPSMEHNEDYRTGVSGCSGCNSEPIHETGDISLRKNKMQQSEKLNNEVANNPHPFVAKQEHAVSGALAGICVSLCLHPIDTIKTVIQSCRAGGQNSIFFIGQSIISERGLTGLYRGISSNITTSAPISAIYTFTYESVKGYLLPSFSKEYHSVAHCTAGASASIATSFIFTPSECIKQQMQVNSQYRNCWNAVFRIIEKGGLLSLYTGWGAVLCRNVPHSIIKFYTYETLKQMFMPLQRPSKQPTTLQTLLCGGIAGSTAALISTPFDVVKTRIQTQVPGSARRYQSILTALEEIHKHEGVRGLYRGLIPRFVMYMSQGALFFASYEFFKSIFSLPLPRHRTELAQCRQDVDDDPLLPL